jgi:hypothetical protein
MPLDRSGLWGAGRGKTGRMWSCSHFHFCQSKQANKTHRNVPIHGAFLQRIFKRMLTVTNPARIRQVCSFWQGFPVQPRYRPRGCVETPNWLYCSFLDTIPTHVLLSDSLSGNEHASLYSAVLYGYRIGMTIHLAFISYHDTICCYKK